MWFAGVLVCIAIAFVVAINAMKDQKRKGKGGFSSFVIGCFAGGFFGAFLLVLLGVAYLVVN
ncbi:hypothetical protein [Salinicola endophyticus]|uniref:DUF4190 domain-containing protein n=1 Tax=Salinicola endophyticus TaxID=1949083 RepID=A0AB74UCZ4_9GAMM